MVRSIIPADVPHHRNPIPPAAVHRGLVVSSAIAGLDPQSGTYPADKAAQIALAFRHFERLLEESGASTQDVVKVDLFFADTADRSYVNPHWLRLYPDEHARPARHAHAGEMPAGCCLQIVFTAVVGDD